MDSATSMVSQQLGPLVLPPGQGPVILFGGGTYTYILAQPIMSQPLSPTYSDMSLSPLTLSPASSQSSEEDPIPPSSQEQPLVTLQCQYPGCYHQLEVPDEQFRGYSFIDVNPGPLTPPPMVPPQPYHEQQTPLTWQQQELLAHDTSNVAPDPAAPVKKPPKQQQKSKKSFGSSKAKTEQPEAAAASENYCRFCYTNKEPVEVFTSHRMKDIWGSVICPILSKYSCEFCGATGPQAHTRKYCPQLDYNFGCRQGRNAIGTPTTIRY